MVGFPLFLTPRARTKRDKADNQPSIREVREFEGSVDDELESMSTIWDERACNAAVVASAVNPT
jgi:hypothetical protein